MSDRRSFVKQFNDPSAKTAPARAAFTRSLPFEFYKPKAGEAEKFFVILDDYEYTEPSWKGVTTEGPIVLPLHQFSIGDDPKDFKDKHYAVCTDVEGGEQGPFSKAIAEIYKRANSLGLKGNIQPKIQAARNYQLVSVLSATPYVNPKTKTETYSVQRWMFPILKGKEQVVHPYRAALEKGIAKRKKRGLPLRGLMMSLSEGGGCSVEDDDSWNLDREIPMYAKPAKAGDPAVAMVPLAKVPTLCWEELFLLSDRQVESTVATILNGTPYYIKDLDKVPAGAYQNQEPTETADDDEVPF